MTALDDLLARLPPRPRVSTGFPMLDAVLGGGFPEGLTVVVCHDKTSGDLLTSWAQRLVHKADPSTGLRVQVVTRDCEERPEILRRCALAERRAVVEFVRAGAEQKMHQREADVLLRAVAYGGDTLTVEAWKNERRPRVTVRFDAAQDGSMAERDVVPAADM